MRLKDKIRIAARLAARQCLKLFWVFPVNRKKILFESFDGEAYSCNPKYLSEYLEQNRPGEYELVWAFNHPEGFSALPGEHRLRVVRKRSLRWYHDYLTACVRVTNVTTQLVFVPKRKRQMVLNTWHAGGAYKRTGIVSEYVQGNDDFEKWRRRSQAGNIDLFLSSSPVFTETNIRAAYRYTGRVLPSGLPRNDLFFDPDRVRRCAAEQREALGISGFVVLYAPTYRGNMDHTDEVPPFPFAAVAAAVHERYGLAPTVLVRAHYFDKHVLRAADSDPDAPLRILDASRAPDMQALLCAADLLITDYSSCIWDYALLGRPCLLYVPDLERYESSDRGFFTPIDEWPGLVCRDEAALCAAIRTLDEEACRRKAEQHLLNFQSYEKGRACEMTLHAIEDFIKTGEV